MPRKSKNIYMQYTTEALDSAVSAVRSGHLSLRKASKKYAVPKTTLIDHVSGRIESGARPGRKPYLTPKVEEALVSKVISAADKGFGMSKSQLILCQSAQIPLQKNVPVDDWWRGLKRRHPELVLRKPERLSTSRIRMLNKPVIDSFFVDLNKVVTELNLQKKPHLIWNADETGKQFEHSPSNVCTKKGTRALQSRTNNSRENVTILACINATGNAMPPLCVAKGKTRKCLQSFNTVDAPDGTLWTYQNKAWMCDILGDEWFNNVFLKHCGPERPQLLIMDSHSSHEVLSLLEKAKQENIHILALPPHCTHALQPLDKTVFGPFNKAYNRLCSEFLAANPNHVVNKASWPRLFNGAWTAAMTSANITKGFKVCGLYPVDRSQIPDSAFLPSSVYDTPLSDHTQPKDGSSSGTSLNASFVESTATTSPRLVSQTIPDSAIASQTAISPISPESPSHVPETNPISVSTISPESQSHVHETNPISVSSAAASPGAYEGVNIPNEDIEPLLQALATGAVSVHETEEKENLSLEYTVYDDIENMFRLPTPVKKTTAKKTVTSHRLLTSNEVIQEKQRAKELKEEKMKAKEERQQKRNINKAAKEDKMNKKRRVKKENVLDKICFICLGEYTIGCKELDWAKCGSCKKWMHLECIPTSHEVNVPFQCHLCG
ncbi:uncharacterized protein LOC117320202 [Pecten maximus]|uniref:uncharacterized protein LOC117320202 n=1 Tax=Pecten maximus TaxID=6579 RepID=UPI00145911D8|nr:uncharacterized protein LOC117320202 [Pecten maximus]